MGRIMRFHATKCGTQPRDWDYWFRGRLVYPYETIKSVSPLQSQGGDPSDRISFA